MKRKWGAEKEERVPEELQAGLVPHGDQLGLKACLQEDQPRGAGGGRGGGGRWRLTANLAST